MLISWPRIYHGSDLDLDFFMGNPLIMVVVVVQRV